MRHAARRDLTEQDPAFFKSDDEMREFAKRLRPEEAFQLSAYAVQFHVKQKQLETVIEARKRARAEKSENKHRMYTKTVADGVRLHPQTLSDCLWPLPGAAPASCRRFHSSVVSSLVDASVLPHPRSPPLPPLPPPV